MSKQPVPTPASLSAPFFYAYGVLFANVRGILNSFDPLALVARGAPANEYDPETHDIIGRLQVAGAGSTPSIVQCVFEEWFSKDLLRGFSRWDELGDEIESAWRSFESRA